MANTQTFITLLGRKYKVIECNLPVDYVSTRPCEDLEENTSVYDSTGNQVADPIDGINEVEDAKLTPSENVNELLISENSTETKNENASNENMASMNVDKESCDGNLESTVADESKVLTEEKTIESTSNEQPENEENVQVASMENTVENIAAESENLNPTFEPNDGKSSMEEENTDVLVDTDQIDVEEGVDLDLLLEEDEVDLPKFEYQASIDADEEVEKSSDSETQDQNEESASEAVVVGNQLEQVECAVEANNEETGEVNGDEETGDGETVGATTVITDSFARPVTRSGSLGEPPSYSESESSQTDGDSMMRVSLSDKLLIVDYAKSEWKGTTFTAECVRKGYSKIISSVGCSYMRQVRGDNYCALRAAVFQILTQRLPVITTCPDRATFLNTLPERLQEQYNCEWLKDWSFANRLPSDQNNRFNVMHACLTFFEEQLSLSEAMSSKEDREAHFLALFNSGSNAEIRLFEAVKLVMLECAMRLYALNCKGEEVPVFVWLLFARDTSSEPQSLMLNHLNNAGNSGGLEQVEMFLLGQALELTVRVVRPSNVDQEDFITHYPDHMVDKWHKLNLIAEDDRHYNILV
nr:uncharacterized protein LOC100177299 isoform X2 [Ciona intestinalis]|eukprot:XP_002128617.1 uncharacterized protein LOC100177299 isoform X2 [Ciona intestinalis]